MSINLQHSIPVFESGQTSGLVQPQRKSPSTILFITSCPLIWGGSEELWAGAAVKLRERGHRVLTGRLQGRLSLAHPKWEKLRESGVRINGFNIPWVCKGIPSAVYRNLPWAAPFFFSLRNRVLWLRMRMLKPDLVVIAQGNTFDGMDFVELPLIAHSAKAPYVLICQKSSELDWPRDEIRVRARINFQNAQRVYFVSKHNRQLTERQIGTDLPHGEVVRNPFVVTTTEPLPWPSSPEGVFKLASVGRMWPVEKGQDLLLNVLAMEKWRSRPVEVDFYGEGPMARGLEEMAQFLKLTNVHFRGFTHDVTEVWRTHHALVMPSRSEGLSLAQVEAMICGRVVIMAPAGGAGEIMEHGRSGFLARSTTEDAMDEALERAWQQRDEWPEIGLRAAQSVWQYFPPDPCGVFADKLEEQLPASTTGTPISGPRHVGLGATPNASAAVSGLLARLRTMISVSRASEWWDFKLPCLLGVAYLTAYNGLLPFTHLWPLLLVILLTLVAGASYVSILNDITDEADDLRAGKSNRIAGRSPFFKLSALALCILPGVLCGWLLQGSRITEYLYLANWVAFTLYSVPPFRLKTRGALGGLADASGGQMLPSLWIASFISSRSPVPMSAGVFAALAVWSLALGLRGILFHQLGDLDHDREAGVETLALRWGKSRLAQVLKYLIFPAEVGALVLLLSQVNAPWTWLFLGLHLFFQWIMMRWLEIDLAVAFPSPRSRVVLFKYYVTFFPLTFALALAWMSWWALILIPIHAVVFPDNWRRFANHWAHVMHYTRYPADRRPPGRINV